MILRRFDPLSCSLKSVHASMNMLFLMNKTKDQISRVSSHGLYWENKMYKRKRSILINFFKFYYLLGNIANAVKINGQKFDDFIPNKMT